MTERSTNYEIVLFMSTVIELQQPYTDAQHFNDTIPTTFQQHSNDNWNTKKSITICNLKSLLSNLRYAERPDRLPTAPAVFPLPATPPAQPHALLEEVLPWRTSS